MLKENSNMHLNHLFKNDETNNSIMRILNGNFTLQIINEFEMKKNLIRIFLSSTFTGKCF